MIMLTVSVQEGALEFHRGDERLLRSQPQPREHSIVLKLTGEIVSDTVYPLQDELESYLSLGICVELDFAEVTFLSTAGQEMLLNVQQFAENVRGCEMRLVHVPDAIYDALDSLNITEHLLIDD